MIFTELFPSDVAGLVLVDASHPDQLRRFREAIGERAVPHFGVERLAAALAWSGLVRLALPADAESKLPASIRAATAAYAPTSLGALLEEADALEETLAVAGAVRSFGDLPLVVLTALAPLDPAQLAAMQLNPSEGERFQAVWKSLQDDEASWSSRSEHVELTDSGHYIQIDRPDVVIAALSRVVEMVR
jgi:pimeloyl-ACP methyl ester carboxylesterase